MKDVHAGVITVHMKDGGTVERRFISTHTDPVGENRLLLIIGRSAGCEVWTSIPVQEIQWYQIEMKKQKPTE